MIKRVFSKKLTMMWIYLAVLVLTVYFLNRWIRGNEKFERIPGPKGIYIFENALDFLMDPGILIIVINYLYFLTMLSYIFQSFIYLFLSLAIFDKIMFVKTKR